MPTLALQHASGRSDVLGHATLSCTIYSSKTMDRINNLNCCAIPLTNNRKREEKEDTMHLDMRLITAVLTTIAEKEEIYQSLRGFEDGQVFFHLQFSAEAGFIPIGGVSSMSLLRLACHGSERAEALTSGSPISHDAGHISM